MIRPRPSFPSDQMPLHDFMCEKVVWHPADFPWFNVTVRIGVGRSSALELFMVPTLDQLKRLVGQQSHNFKIEAIQYVTPGAMNGSGQWKMEPLLEVTELCNEGGWSIPRCKVDANRIYRGLSLEAKDEWSIERPVYVQP